MSEYDTFNRLRTYLIGIHSSQVAEDIPDEAGISCSIGSLIYDQSRSHPLYKPPSFREALQDRCI